MFLKALLASLLPSEGQSFGDLGDVLLEQGGQTPKSLLPLLAN
jgi:hypothetical protein